MKIGISETETATATATLYIFEKRHFDSADKKRLMKNFPQFTIYFILVV